MTLQIERKLFSRKDYHRMAEAGILQEEEKVELINGNIIRMSPIGCKHMAGVNRLIRLFNNPKFIDEYILSVQNPIAIDEISEPEPDLALLKYKDDFYESEKPTPQDVILVIEVSDTSIEKDKDIKIPLYAKAGIAESWIVDVLNEMITVYSNPSEDQYLQTEEYKIGEIILLDLLPDVSVPVSKVFHLA